VAIRPRHTTTQWPVRTPSARREYHRCSSEPAWSSAPTGRRAMVQRAGRNGQFGASRAVLPA